MTKKSSKPSKLSTSAISQPLFSGILPISSSFSHDGDLFALVTLAVDKHRLRIFNVVASRATAEHTIQDRRVSSLIWSTLSLEDDILSEEITSPAKKRKKRRVEDDEEQSRKNLETILFVGLSDGTIIFFSPSHSKVVRTLSHPSSISAITSLTRSISGDPLLWTSSSDSSVHLWDVQKGTLLKSWKNDDRIPYTSLAIRPSPNEKGLDLLAAHHHIRLLTDISISTSSEQKQIASFTGHATSIKLLRWLKAPNASRRFFMSAAVGDRFVYMWDSESASINDKPIASFSLDSDVRTVEFDSSKQTFMALSSSGKLSFVPIPADFPMTQSSSEKIYTLLPRSTLISGSKGKNDPPIIDLAPNPSSTGAIWVARLVNGVEPVFDTVRYLDSSGNYERNLTLDGIRDHVADDGPQLSTKRYAESSSLGVGSGIDPDQFEAIRDSATQREIDGSLQTDLAELSLGQRLAAVTDAEMDPSSGSDDNELEGPKTKQMRKKADKTDISVIPANSLTRTLIQALHSSDSRLLEMCLGHTDPVLIRNTVRKIPPQLAIPLINACVERLGRGARGANMKGRGGGASSQRGTGLVVWINTVLAVHTGHLMTIPDVVARLSGLYATLSERLSLHESLLSLSGRLDTVLSQVEHRAARAPTTREKAAISKPQTVVKRYVEGESDSEEEEDQEMDVEVEEGSDQGSVEDIELGGSEDEDEGSEDSEERNEFIDDEAEEDEEEYTDEDEEESE